LTKTAASLARGRAEPPLDRALVAPMRPGWVYELVIAVLAAANQPLRPQDVIQQAERVRGHRIAPSSIRNCLREAALCSDSVVERLGYGRYRLRR